MAAKGRAKVTFKTGRLVSRTLRATQKGLDEVAKDMTRVLKKAIGRQGPPRSKPFNFPKKETGRLHSSTKVVRLGRKLVVNTLGYGQILDKGAPGHGLAPRPWLTPKVFAADAARTWRRKINTAIRKHAKR